MSATQPIESAIRHEHSDDWDLELDGRERDRLVEEELAYLMREPIDYATKADPDVIAQVVIILHDGKDDQVGRCRDVIAPDMRRVAEREARNYGTYRRIE